MTNDLKQMKVRETELIRLKNIQGEKDGNYAYSRRPIYSLSDCITYLLDVNDKLDEMRINVQWNAHYRKDSGMRVVVTLPDEMDFKLNIKGAVDLLQAFEQDPSQTGHVTSACIILQRLLDGPSLSEVSPSETPGPTKDSEP